MVDETERTYTEQQLVTFAALVSRRLALVGGQTAYGGQRDYYESLGYPDEITFQDYLRRYQRQDIAGRIVDLPAQDTWKKPPAVSESDDVETDFVKAWEQLVKLRRVWAMLSRADKLSGIGQYGVLLIGLRDGKALKEPVEQGKLSSPKDILYLQPFSEGAASISQWDKDTKSERYGLPLEYKLTLGGEGQTTTDATVHWTRVLHLAEGKTDSEIYGLPRLQRCYNRLDDLMKLVGGTAEATWLNMRPGTMVSPKEGYRDDISDDDFIDEVRRFLHDPARIWRLGGMEAKTMGSGEVLDPIGPFEVELSLIAAASDIPQRVLIGSAKGELAAAKEDMRQWAGQIAERQASYAGPEVLRPFIDRLVWYGVLPSPANGPDAYDIGTLHTDGSRYWPPLVEMDELEQADIMLKKAQAQRTLADPLEGTLRITDAEARELLGYPSELKPLEGEPEPEALRRAVIGGLATYSHEPEIDHLTCPLCGEPEVFKYKGHGKDGGYGPWRVCPGCGKAFNSEVE